MTAGPASYTFPVLDNVYFELILVDLRAYRAADEWALAFQVVALAQGDLVVAIYGYGNRVDPPGVRHIVTLARSPALVVDARHAHLSMDLSGQAFHRDISTADLAGADISTPPDQLTVLDALRVIAAGTPAPAPKSAIVSVARRQRGSRVARGPHSQRGSTSSVRSAKSSIGEEANDSPSAESPTLPVVV